MTVDATTKIRCDVQHCFGYQLTGLVGDEARRVFFEEGGWERGDCGDLCPQHAKPGATCGAVVGEIPDWMTVEQFRVWRVQCGLPPNHNGDCARGGDES